ncbi:hypothetical protein H8K52_14215 [Undibacterium seohonense]|uniref:Uncharacterized protein n=1 Tax=Undibacterium seohonense TaxID=1344950 RepID=A0ABR6X7D4_9BURK|nr:hypothetical protein [Undibacterium seohonense]MBC3808495.1 hypothetical protein [Undibacterium seohonense]
MTLQNRVTPFGQLKAINARGLFLGNRGKLHNDEKRIIKQWDSNRWITCSIEYQGIRREIFSEGSYSELFFLDEATALSAGHRPCGDCRRERLKEFKLRWQQANSEDGDTNGIKVELIDTQMHAERTKRDGTKVTYQTKLGELPDGVFISIDGIALLKWNNKLFEWSASGYIERFETFPDELVVDVLTPRSVVGVIRAGYIPQVHQSATG